MVPWKSRWSRVRFVKTAVWKRSPYTRPSASACDETSSVACVPPARSSSANSRTRSSDSGVVLTAGSTRPARWYSMVPTSAVVWPAARSTESIRYAGGGLAIGPRDARQPQPLVRLAIEVARRQCQRLPPVLHLNPAPGAPEGTSDSLTTATAPRASASAANCRPSARLPGKAKNKKPAPTRLESYSSPPMSALASSGDTGGFLCLEKHIPTTVIITKGGPQINISLHFT